MHGSNELLPLLAARMESLDTSAPTAPAVQQCAHPFSADDVPAVQIIDGVKFSQAVPSQQFTGPAAAAVTESTSQTPPNEDQKPEQGPRPDPGLTIQIPEPATRQISGLPMTHPPPLLLNASRDEADFESLQNTLLITPLVKLRTDDALGRALSLMMCVWSVSLG